MRNVLPIGVGLLAIVLGCGCGGPAGPELAPVKGQVTYKGKPLEKGTIGFLSAGGRSAFGKIVGGQITEVTTFSRGDGAPVGTHKVQIQAIDNPDDMYAKHTSLIPEKYGNPNTSGLTAEVKAKQENTFTFELKD